MTVQAPAPGATGVPLNTTVTASFSKAMNAATITTASFRLRAAGSTADVPATVTVNAAGTLATLTPSSPLGAGTVYTATVAGSVTDAIGTPLGADSLWRDRKSTRLNSSHGYISYAVFCLKKKKKQEKRRAYKE